MPKMHTVLAVYLHNSWWPVEDILKTADLSREGLIQVQTFEERIVLFVLNDIIFGRQERSLMSDVVFIPHPEEEQAKIFWKNREAVAFYTVKAKGSLCGGHSSQCYLLPVLDTVFVQKRFRRCGLGTRMLQDFCKTFATEEALGISSPISADMYQGSELLLASAETRPGATPGICCGQALSHVRHLPLPWLGLEPLQLSTAATPGPEAILGIYLSRGDPDLEVISSAVAAAISKGNAEEGSSPSGHLECQAFVVCQRFLDNHPEEQSRLWEVEAPGGWSQRTSVWLTIQLARNLPKKKDQSCHGEIFQDEESGQSGDSRMNKRPVQTPNIPAPPIRAEEFEDDCKEPLSSHLGVEEHGSQQAHQCKEPKKRVRRGILTEDIVPKQVKGASYNEGNRS
uniref:Uncharacterized protein n=1 Tax=Sphaerodactylus townsendi TaxID=933632 RepID=A0ACB8E6B7_9SAUR